MASAVGCAEVGAEGMGVGTEVGTITGFLALLSSSSQGLGTEGVAPAESFGTGLCCSCGFVLGGASFGACKFLPLLKVIAAICPLGFSSG